MLRTQLSAEAVFHANLSWRHSLDLDRYGSKNRMKKIEAVIQPFKLEDVQKALEEAGAGGMTISDVRGYGRQKGHKEIYRGREYETGVLPKIKIEVVAGDRDVEAIVEAIVRAARTGKIGDGKIFVFDVVEAIRIRNGNINESAV